MHSTNRLELTDRDGMGTQHNNIVHVVHVEVDVNCKRHRWQMYISSEIHQFDQRCTSQWFFKCYSVLMSGHPLIVIQYNVLCYTYQYKWNFIRNFARLTNKL